MKNLFQACMINYARGEEEGIPWKEMRIMSTINSGCIDRKVQN